MSRWLRLFILCFAVLHALPASAQQPAPKQPTEEQKKEASARFKRGVGFYKERDFRNALIEFKAAYEIAPNYKVLFNLGQTSFELKDYVEAQKAFSAYLEQGGKEITATRRKEVEGELAKLETYVAHLKLVFNVEGAEVAIDGVAIGKTPITDPILVSAGRRKIEAQKAGFAPLERYVDIAGGETKEAAFELAALTVEPPPPPPPEPEVVPVPKKPPEELGHRTPFWVLLGTTLALGTATGVMGGLALKAKSDHEDELATYPNTPDNLEDAADKVVAYAAVTDVLAGLTGAAAIATLIVGILDFTPSSEALLVPGGMVLRGRF